ncbi:MAG: hypothetical protein LBL36_05520, partial [Clostridiales Family XIII bacterium]|nr:hypothetical protein [Clostridiales Family XIII bacterium]
SALDRLNVIIECKENFSVYDKLIESISANPAIIEYCKTKLSISVTPLLMALIEQGNADGSLQCEYPEETTLFILQGIEGAMPKIADLSDAERKRKMEAHKDIIFRVLGAKA